MVYFRYGFVSSFNNYTFDTFQRKPTPAVKLIQSQANASEQADYGSQGEYSESPSC